MRQAAIVAGAPSSNTDKFTGKADAYVRYRERYDPAIVLPYLREWCGLQPEWTVADVGAGTGMLGDLFRANGNAVVAIEPNADMRAACERLHEGDADFRVMNGTAEATGMADASVEMISIGRALHFFNVDPALREMRRILKPEGWVAILASGREEGGRPENDAFELLMRAASQSFASTRAGYAVYKRMDEFFAGGEIHHAEVPGEMRMNWETLRGLTLSHSHAPLPGSEGFEEFERALVEYFRRFEQEGKVTLATRTRISAGRFAGPEVTRTSEP